MNDWHALYEELTALEAAVLRAAERAAATIDLAREDRRASVRNLIHYLSLRQQDVRKLQLRLADAGLSSLGRSEGHVLGNLQAVRRILAQLAGKPASIDGNLTWTQSEALLHSHTRAIFGKKPAARHVYIMVTAPDVHVADAAWFDRMLDAGLDLLRINGAHGLPADWAVLVERARAAAGRAGRAIKIAVDLPGPKLRTVSLSEDARVLKLQPKRDEWGRVIEPCRIWIGARATLQIPEAVEAAIEVGDELSFQDTRGRHRHICITGADPRGGFIGELTRTAYLGAATELQRKGKARNELRFTIANVPARPVTKIVPIGGQVVLIRTPQGVPAHLAAVPAFGCTLPQALDGLRPGAPVKFDDGKVLARVDAVTSEYAILTIEHATRGEARLRGDMGINLPETVIAVAAVSEGDASILAFAEAYADIVALSFVRSVEDVRGLEALIRRKDLGLILKIETRAGFESLPRILLETLGRRDMAVMIARGDLAVECGFERLAELQEEILWLCEAAHVPVVWATQVLESLAKTGFPTRAEVTDAAMSVRAECVMLNKGPFIEEATRSLDSILRRMEGHQYKKRNLYRPLHLPVPGYVSAP